MYARYFIADGRNLDFEKTFIQAIVYNYDVLKEYGTENDVKAAGKVMTKGKDYEMVRLKLLSLSPANKADSIERLMEISCWSKLGLRNHEFSYRQISPLRRSSRASA